MVDRRTMTLWVLVEIAACGGRLTGVPDSTDAGAPGVGGSRTGGTGATGGLGDSTGSAGVGGFGGASTGTGAGGGSGGFGAAGGTGGPVGGSGGASGKAGSGGVSGAAGGARDSGTSACPSGTTPASGRSSACWISRVCEVRPIQPTYSVAEACMRAASSKAWMSKPIPGGDPWMDVKALLVGQWIACNPADGIEAIEFGANGRFRHLVKSADGYVPVSGNPATERGFYWYVNEGGELDLSDDNVDLMATMDVDYLEILPTREAIRSNTIAPGFPKGIYARGKPSPSNGWDNPPNIETPTCRLVGTWDTDPIGISPQYLASYSFDEAGNFVVTPGTAVDLCTNHTMHGTYAIVPGGLMLTHSVGMGKCGFPDRAGFSLDFTAATCSQARLTVVWDGCSPDRGYLSQPTTLVKRQ